MSSSMEIVLAVALPIVVIILIHIGMGLDRIEQRLRKLDERLDNWANRMPR